MKKIFSVIIALVLCCAAFTAFAESPTVSVVGNATVIIPADICTVNVGVYVTDTEAIAALASANTVADKLRTEIAALGIEDKDITSDHLYFYSYTGDADQPVYSANESVYIVVRDLSLVGTVIDTALANGANSVDGITFSASDTRAAQDQALTDAVADAGRRARALATATGSDLGDIVSVTDSGSYTSGISNYAMAESAKGDGETMLTSSGVEVTASVTIVYELK